MADISFTYTVTNSADSTALGSVHVWATSDIGGQTVLDSGTTAAVTGIVTLTLAENSEVYIWTAKSGYNADANPDNETVTVAGGGGTMTAIVTPVPDQVVLSNTCLDLISDALTECGILAQGETATSADSQFALDRLNRMMELWNIQRRLVYQINIARYTLTADATSHTIGPGGTLLADRPNRIVKANIVVTGYTPELHSPVRIVETAEEWANVTTPLLSAAVPSDLYCDYDWPNATLYLYPYPDEAYDLELFTWEPLTAFTTLTHAVNFPPGYYDALMYSLAERLCTPFGVPPQTKAQISADAAKARYFISSHNVHAPVIGNDTGIPNTEAL